jgi:hypothetical protein
MNKRCVIIATLAGASAIASNLEAQDNRTDNTKPPPLEDRVGQLEKDDQNLKGQMDQLSNEVADLQDQLKLNGGQPSSRQPGARSSQGDRDRGLTRGSNQSSQGEQSFDVFYQGLQTGGHWFDDPTYGQVWQPDVANSDHNWRPYSDGHWAHTDRGWTWISNEDFGWATYHYGRWARRSDSGWIWIPGSRWAPAWVSWRENNDDVGWAPLPPEVADDSQATVGGWVDNYYDIGPAAYLFVKTGDLSRPTYRDVIVQPSQDTEFYARSKNVTSISFGGDIVTVNGPRYERIASQTKIPTYKLNYVNESDGRFGIKTAGNELNVAAPAANLQRTASTQPKIEKTLAQAQVDDGWQKVNKEQAAQLKKTAEQQAPVPANLPAKPAPPKPIAGNNTQGQQTENNREKQNQSARLQPAPQRAGEESQSSSPTPANSPQTESRDARQERTQNSSKATPTPTEESRKREPVSQQQQPRTEQTQPSEKRSSTEDKEKSSAPKQREQTEQGREQPANGSENRTAPRSESQREESARSQKSEESQNQSDVERRGDQKQPENAKPEQKRTEKKEQKPEQPRKEESSSR